MNLVEKYKKIYLRKKYGLKIGMSKNKNVLNYFTSIGLESNEEYAYTILYNLSKKTQEKDASIARRLDIPINVYRELITENATVVDFVTSFKEFIIFFRNKPECIEAIDRLCNYLENNKS